ncbi:heme exporter protein D (CcmD) [mine drainage metagenome]|jgi:heme exporter protein D|uniref:Cytochrome c-type biogenesis protein CcmD n=1 Tax=mine drainage metagenome TaxID=410659 RepID=A0A1J5SZQ1_9ZZZZ
MNWSEFFAMNGYAFYVWGSYGVALFVLGVEILLVRNRRKNALRELRLMRDEMGDDKTGEAA